MKCPECDLEQPDSAAICAGCGLSFEMWRQANPGVDLSADAPHKEMSFPGPEEETQAPSGDNTPTEKETEEEGAAPGTADHASNQGPGSASAGPTEDFPSEDKPSPGARGGMKLTNLHFAGIGIGLFALLGLLFFFFHHRTPKIAPNPGAMNPQPTAIATAPSTPGNPITPSPSGGTPNSPTSTIPPFYQAAPPAAQPTPLPAFTSTPIPAPTPQDTPAAAPADTPTAAAVTDSSTPAPTPNPDFWKQ